MILTIKEVVIESKQKQAKSCLCEKPNQIKWIRPKAENETEATREV